MPSMKIVIFDELRCKNIHRSSVIIKPIIVKKINIGMILLDKSNTHSMKLNIEMYRNILHEKTRNCIPKPVVSL